MQTVTLIGIDLGKHSCHVLCQNLQVNALLRKKFSRSQLATSLVTYPACIVVMESCAGAHYMARAVSQRGHRVKLMASQFLRLFVKTILLMLKLFARQHPDLLCVL